MLENWWCSESVEKFRMVSGSVSAGSLVAIDCQGKLESFMTKQRVDMKVCKSHEIEK